MASCSRGTHLASVIGRGLAKDHFLAKNANGGRVRGECEHDEVGVEPVYTMATGQLTCRADVLGYLVLACQCETREERQVQSWSNR